MDIIETLNATGQQDLAAHLETLTGDARKLLERDIASQDWEELKALYTEKSNASKADNVSADLKPMPFRIAEDDLKYNYWKEIGEMLLGKGKVAAFLVAGGQVRASGSTARRACSTSGSRVTRASSNFRRNACRISRLA